MSIIDQFDDNQFIKIISESTTWKEISEKFGYKNTLSSNLKKKIINRCKDLKIDSPQIKQIINIEDQTKGDLFNNRKIGKALDLQLENQQKEYLKNIICLINVQSVVMINIQKQHI